MSAEYISKKGQIGQLTTKNRLVMTAMGVGLGEWEGNVTDEFTQFYAERAKGGAGLIITEIVRVNEIHGIGEHDQISLAKDSNIPSWKKLADALHQYDTKLFAQLHHPGKETYTALLVDNQPTVSSSAIPSTSGQQPTRALETEEVQALVRDFGAAAARAKQAGVDGVELHAAHGYLIAQFLSAHANHRTDQYGGSLENRQRFLLEIIAEIQKTCGKDYPISVRLSGSEFMETIGVEDGITLDESISTAVACEKAGAALVNVSAGCYDTGNTIVEPTSYEQGWKVYLAAEIRKHLSIPVATTGVIRDPEFADKLIMDGTTDFIGMGRSWLADPEWGVKAIEGRGADIRKCTGCMYCFETAGNTLVTGGGAASCAINPRMGRETHYPALEAHGNGRRVVVIGAGPGGLQASMTLAECGFTVTLLEKNGYLGGQMYLSSLPPHKEKMGYYISYAKKQLDDHGVDIRLNTAASAELVKELQPFAVVVATGSAPVMPRSIKGIDLPNAYTPVQILTEEVKLEGKKVCVIGSGLTGLETGEFLAERGNEVSIYEMQDKIGPDAFPLVCMDVTGALARLGVRTCPGHKLVEIKEHSVIFEDNAGFTIEEPCDAAVVSLGIRPVSNLVAELSDLQNVFAIGDADKLGRIPQAVSAGYETAIKLNEMIETSHS
jgi:2,4-dienoyl-CoA reductase-like NADH-dependent reductase (Old Yellow Enzyme family)/thioredoxin reductase